MVFGDNTEPQMVPKFSLQVYVRGMNNILVNYRNYGCIKEARDEENDSIISNSTSRMLLPKKSKQMSARYKAMCGFECFISDKSIHAYLLSWRDQYLKKLKDQSQNAENRNSGEK